MCDRMLLRQVTDTAAVFFQHFCEKFKTAVTESSCRGQISRQINIPVSERKKMVSEFLRRRAQIGNHETACRRAAGRGGLITDFNHGNPVAVCKGAQSVRAVERNDPSGSLTDHLRYDVTGLGHRFPCDDVHGALSPVQCDFRIGGIFRKVGVPERRQKQKHISCPCGYARRCFRRAGKKGSASASADHQMFRFQFIQHQFRNFGTDVQDLRQFSLRGKTVAGAQIALFDPVQDIFSGLIFQCFF